MAHAPTTMNRGFRDKTRVHTLKRGRPRENEGDKNEDCLPHLEDSVIQKKKTKEFMIFSFKTILSLVSMFYLSSTMFQIFIMF